jgi:hypothetical protein
VRPALAVLMDHRFVSEMATAIFIQGGKLAHGDVPENNAEQVVRVGRATG